MLTYPAGLMSKFCKASSSSSILCVCEVREYGKVAHDRLGQAIMCILPESHTWQTSLNRVRSKISRAVSILFYQQINDLEFRLYRHQKLVEALCDIIQSHDPNFSIEEDEVLQSFLDPTEGKFVLFIHQTKLENTVLLCCSKLSHDMRFPTMWHFDMCRLRQACVASF